MAAWKCIALLALVAVASVANVAAEDKEKRVKKKEAKEAAAAMPMGGPEMIMEGPMNVVEAAADANLTSLLEFATVRHRRGAAADSWARPGGWPPARVSIPVHQHLCSIIMPGLQVLAGPARQQPAPALFKPPSRPKFPALTACPSLSLSPSSLLPSADRWSG